MYKTYISDGIIGITCCADFRPPLGLFPIQYLTLVNVIVDELNRIDPEGRLVHERDVAVD